MPDRTDTLEREVAAAFTEVLAPRPGDEAKLAAMIELALRPPPGGAPPPPQAAPAKLWPRLVGAGGVVVAAVTTVAWLATGSQPTPKTTAAVDDMPAALAPALLPAAPDADDRVTLDVEVAPAPPEADLTAVPLARVARSTPRPARPVGSLPSMLEQAVTPEDPDALLRAANQARRARAFAEADRLYTDLQARFPGSRAARTSRVPHARLLLDTLDRPADAFASFSAYLDADPRGTLSEEALVGQAQALRRLGREVEARDAWRSLLVRFPESVHAPTAHDQIAEVRP